MWFIRDLWGDNILERTEQQAWLIYLLIGSTLDMKTMLAGNFVETSLKSNKHRPIWVWWWIRWMTVTVLSEEMLVQITYMGFY